ncbi:MAG TPA: hypothetical protein VN673_16925 [Clostridia bacterium]|nr:hypothetical protein [Clostridia bacterium]
MKTAARNSTLALIGLAGLTIYILACTSFSPDDSKVTYPAFDENGQVGIAVYDRSERNTQMLYLPATFAADGTNASGPELLRAQFLPDGRHIAVFSFGSPEDSGTSVRIAVLPWATRTATRIFEIPELSDSSAAALISPVIVGHRAFLMGSNQVLRLDLLTGRLHRHHLTEPGPELSLYPSPRGNTVFFIQEAQNDQPVRFGTMDPESFKQTTLMTITNDVMEGSFFTYNNTGSQVALVVKADEERRLVVLEKGIPRFTRTLDRGEGKLTFGSAVLSPKSDFILASFQRTPAGATNASFGLMEIPLSTEPIRETLLITSAPSGDEMESFYFQPALSHDGKTAAVASTYLALGLENLKAEDCALFLVDLSDRKRKVTRVPIPMPKERNRISF